MRGFTGIYNLVCPVASEPEPRLVAPLNARPLTAAGAGGNVATGLVNTIARRARVKQTDIHKQVPADPTPLSSHEVRSTCRAEVDVSRTVNASQSYMAAMFGDFGIQSVLYFSAKYVFVIRHRCINDQALLTVVHRERAHTAAAVD